MKAIILIVTFFIISLDLNKNFVTDITVNDLTKSVFVLEVDDETDEDIMSALLDEQPPWVL